MDRDLLGGLFEHTAVMKLISERCTKLMPFFTPTFFHSAHNQFLVDFAQWSVQYSAVQVYRTGVTGHRWKPTRRSAGR